MKRICVVCVRAGSKSVPGKNIKMFCDKPLMAHTITHALDSELFDVICVSSDSQKYLDIAMEYGATDTVLRPAKLASDEAAKIPVIRHAVREMEDKHNTVFECVVDLQVTSPLRLAEDIVLAVGIFDQGENLQNVISVKEAHSSPYFTLVERGDSNKIVLSKTLETAVVRRQDAPLCYDLNGSIYVWCRQSLQVSNSVLLDRTEIYVMPDYRSLDIDNPLDFLLAEFVYKNVDIEGGRIR